MTTPPAPHHASDGTFRNPWPDSEPHGFRDILRWERERRGETRAPTPPHGSFPTATPSIARPHLPDGDATATWIGHSTVLLQIGRHNILTDPQFSRRASPVQWAGPARLMDPGLAIDDLPPLDLIVVSHNHYDHLDRGSVKRIAKRQPTASWIVPLGLAATLRKWGAGNVVELDWWQRALVGDLTITATPAKHFSARSLRDRNRTLWCGFVVDTPVRRVWFAGDSAYHPEFADIGARLGPFDLTMIPIGAYDPRWFMHVVHMDPEEAVRVYQDAAGQTRPLMLGIHWGTFRLTDEPMDEPPRRARTRWRELGLPDDRLWIARFGETRAF